MIRDEESLMADLVARRYGYLYGMGWDKDQWSRSEDLQRLLSPLKGVTPLAKWPDRGKEASEVWRAVASFRAMNIDPRRFGFEFRGDARAWTALPYSGVYWYRERLAKVTPVWISCQGHLIDQRQNELFFDGTTQQLVIVWRLDLEPLVEQ